MVRTGLIDDIKMTFERGNMLTKLIYVNLGVFLFVKIATIILVLFGIGSSNVIVEWLSVPADVFQLIRKPWTLITYMFLHEGFFHILFNLLWLFWFGKIFLEYLTDKQLLNVYLLGGLFGASLYIISYNIFPLFSNVLPFSMALGASASVMAIVISTAVYVPNYTVYLMFFGPVKLKYIAIVSVVLDIVLLLDGNSGGHIAHIGGAMFGYFYTTQLKKGNEIFRGFGKTIDSVWNWFKPKKNLKVTYKRSESDREYKKRKKSEQKRIDEILEKISKSGYNSLSKEEKDILFRQSRNN
jgi:membrane associated rhomboid family serine protease